MGMKKDKTEKQVVKVSHKKILIICQDLIAYSFH